jgi:hypothetical protein
MSRRCTLLPVFMQGRTARLACSVWWSVSLLAVEVEAPWCLYANCWKASEVSLT